MITNIGIDIEQVSRFKKKDIGLLNGIFSKNELKSRKGFKAQHLAGIFSAKEAIIKACNPVEKLLVKNIEIAHKKDGSPYVVLKRSKKVRARDLKVSISHSGDYVIASAILSMK